MRKPDFCLCAFVFATRTVQFLIFLNPNFRASSLFSEAVQAGLCQAWSETLKTVFLASQLILCLISASAFWRITDTVHI